MTFPFVKSQTPSRSAGIEAYVASEDGKAAVEALLQHAAAREDVLFHAGTLATAGRLAGIAEFAPVVFAEVGDMELADLLDAVREISGTGTELVLLGHEAGISTYRAVIGAGARDYIPLPLSATDAILDMPARVAPSAGPSSRKGRAIAICGVSGGVGASFLAANLAVAFARDLSASASSHQVALIDADLGSGSLAIDLNVDPTRGYLDALTAPERIDGTFLASAMAEPVPGVRMFSSEADVLPGIGQLETGIAPLLRVLKEETATTVIDLPRRLLGEQPALVDEFDDLVLVLTPGFAPVRSCARLMERIGATGPEDLRIWIVLSQTRRDAGLRPSEIETALDHTIAVRLPPLSPGEMARALIKGEPLQKHSPKSRYSRAVSDLAARLSPPESRQDRPARGGFLGRRRKGA
ncbi:AAA family ATPase [Celeribacter indicus]|uniref:AAA family ATPase n=1 Tax=Celeribacter indicus TaxID=1208324 RepID=UPI001114EA1C|nr:hypothetical protein [Celeribacter indicus]